MTEQPFTNWINQRRSGRETYCVDPNGREIPSTRQRIKTQSAHPDAPDETVNSSDVRDVSSSPGT